MRASMGEYEANYGGQDSVSLTFGSTGERSSNVLIFLLLIKKRLWLVISQELISLTMAVNVPNSGTGPKQSYKLRTISRAKQWFW